ncbi:hypothetical protein PORY_001964 [Pneumocystis oryctolagi]|uniref:Uncharacterized protein n=1 Tax=Pneumocystis oryctolagi TaxID=42067 RepID=A0ACB7CAJ7_9ASCO|nr:hypothetical protein PORY_001964 [Pneumocystis oryctolagi]
MVVCRFFLEGRCRFGDYCRNEHVTTKKSGFFGQNKPFQGGFKPTIINHSISESLIEDDLGKDHPQWPFTCYGTGKGHPNLISGKDISPEELRAFAYKYMENMDFYGYKNSVEKLSQEIQELRNNMTKNSRKACRIAIDILNGKFSGNIDSIFSNAFSSNSFTSAFSVFSNQTQASFFTHEQIQFGTNQSSFSTNTAFPVQSSAFEKTKPFSPLFNKNNAFNSPFCSNSSNTLSFGTPSFSLTTASSNEPMFKNTSFIQKPISFGNNHDPPKVHQSSYSTLNIPTSAFSQFNNFNPAQEQSLFNCKSIFNQQSSVFGTSHTFQANTTPVPTFTFQSNTHMLEDSFPVSNQQHTGNTKIILLNQGTLDSLSESDLSESALEAFKARTFTLGKIPEIEPPLSLRS